VISERRPSNGSLSLEPHNIICRHAVCAVPSSRADAAAKLINVESRSEPYRRAHVNLDLMKSRAGHDRGRPHAAKADL
jgi:hypothetical protein